MTLRDFRFLFHVEHTWLPPPPSPLFLRKVLSALGLGLDQLGKV